MIPTHNTKRFIVLGDAGAGKSSFINFLYNYYHGTKDPKEIFCDNPRVKLAIPCANWTDRLDERHKNNKSEHNIDDQTQSQTQMCTPYTIRVDTTYLEIIDTPGFNDTNGTDVDAKNLRMIEKALKRVPFLNGIIMIVNGSSPRLGVSFKNFLHMLHQVWPNDLMNNCVAILTNCDELSVNLDSSILKRDLNVDDSKKFHLQNSLFRWNRKIESKKTIRRFQEDFEDNLETIKLLVKKLFTFGDVLTTSFSVGAIKILLIEKCIDQSIQNMVDLLEKYKEHQVALAGIAGAQDTMENNKQWDKQREINAIRWVEVERCRSSPPSRSQQRHQQQLSYNDQQGMQPRDQKAEKSKINDRSQTPSMTTNKSDQRRCEPMPAVNTEGKHVKTTAQGRSLVSDNNDDNQQGPHQTELGQAYSDSTGAADLNYSTGAGEAHYRRGVGGPHHLTGADRPYSSAGVSRSHFSEDIERSDNHCTASPESNDVNRRDEGNSKRPISGNRPGTGYTGAKYPGSSHKAVYEKQQTRIQVTLPDNEARAQHKYAQQQESRLRERTQYLADEKHALEHSMMSLLEQLKEQVAELRSINNKYDIIDRNCHRLKVFRDSIKYMGDDPQMISYHDQTVAILSNKHRHLNT